MASDESIKSNVLKIVRRLETEADECDEPGQSFYDPVAVMEKRNLARELRIATGQGTESLIRPRESTV